MGTSCTESGKDGTMFTSVTLNPEERGLKPKILL